MNDRQAERIISLLEDIKDNTTYLKLFFYGLAGGALIAMAVDFIRTKLF